MTYLDRLFERFHKNKNYNMLKWIFFLIFFILLCGAYILFFLKINIIIEKTGEVNYSKAYTINVPYDSFVNKVYVSDGERVSNRQLLFELHNTGLEIDKTRAKHLYIETKIKLNSLEGYGSSLKERKLLDAELMGYAEELSALEKELQKSIVRSPIDGFVSGIDLQKLAGHLVLKGNKLCTVYQKGSKIIRVKLIAREVNLIKRGNPVTMTPLVDRGKDFRGTVSHIYEFPEDKKYYADIGTLKMPELKAGTKVRARIITEKIKIIDTLKKRLNDK